MTDDFLSELEGVLEDPLFAVTEEEMNLFSFPESLRVKAKRENQDYVAQRVVCKEFYKYEPLFKRVHAELKAGRRSLVKYNVNRLKMGTFYIISGVMVYLEKIDWEKRDSRRHYPDGRTRLIYENGAESDIKVNSLARSVYTDGFVITECRDGDETEFQASFSPADTDQQTGWIYVLRSCSTHADIANQKDLYKIGYSTTPVATRIKNCEYEPTYLMDQVEVVATWSTYNLNTQKFEALLHQFLSSVRFRVKVCDMAGETHEPQEWFVVPLPIIQSVVHHIITGEIVHYRYNATLQLIEELQPQEPMVQGEAIDTAGWAILPLVIKAAAFQQLLSGEKSTECRELKQSKTTTYTWVEQGTRYLKKFDAIRFYVGARKDREMALVEVVDTQYDSDRRMITFGLGRVLEVKGEK